MQYTTRLPAVHLRGEALTGLEDTLLSGCTAPELDIELIKGRATYHYESLRAVREDVTLPGVIRSFVVRVQSREGELELVADDQTNEFSLQLQGQREWVNGKRESIESFFGTHGARVRTFLERYMAFALTGIVVTVGLVAYYSGMGGLVGMRTPVDALLLGSLALIGGGLFHLALNAVYPYAALITSSRAQSYLTYLRP
jgi:hypothetical protein